MKKTMFEFISTIITSPITNTVLFLLIFFQWDRQYAKDQNIKNNLLAAKGIVDDSNDPSTKYLSGLLDATLATVGARSPFQKYGGKIIKATTMRLEKLSHSSIKKIRKGADVFKGPIL